MSNVPPNPSGGAPVPTHDDFEKLRQYAVATHAASGAPGIRRRTFRGGTLLSPIQKQGKRQLLPKRNPLSLYKASDGVSLKYGVINGTVNGIIPTLGGSPINSDPAPTETITVTTWVWLKCETTFGAPDTHVVTIHSTTTSTHPGDSLSATGFTSYLLLGEVTVSGSEITRVTSYSGPAWGTLFCDSSGSNIYWITP